MLLKTYSPNTDSTARHVIAAMCLRLVNGSKMAANVAVVLKAMLEMENTVLLKVSSLIGIFYRGFHLFSISVVYISLANHVDGQS